MEDLSHCQRGEKAEGIPLCVLLLSFHLMSVPPVDQTQPEPGVIEVSHAVYGEAPLRSESREDKGREWNGIGKRVVTDNNPYSSKGFRAFCVQALHQSVLNVEGLKNYVRAVMKEKQEMRESPWNTGICMLFVVAFNLLSHSLFY